MSDEDHITQACGPGGFCGACPTPCFLLDQEPESSDSLIEQGPDLWSDISFAGLVEDLESTDTFALGCPRWDDPEADCNSGTCAGNFFCFKDYSTGSQADQETQQG
jgi:hypothetical protein